MDVRAGSGIVSTVLPPPPPSTTLDDDDYRFYRPVLSGP